MPQKSTGQAPGTRTGALFDLAQGRAEGFEPGLVVLGIAVIQEAVVAPVRTQNLVRMLDGAEVLLGAAQDLVHVGHQSAAVSAVGAVEFLDEVEVLQVLAVEHDVVAAPHLGDAVDRETAPLVETHEQRAQMSQNLFAIVSIVTLYTLQTWTMRLTRDLKLRSILTRIVNHRAMAIIGVIGMIMLTAVGALGGAISRGTGSGDPVSDYAVQLLVPANDTTATTP